MCSCRPRVDFSIISDKGPRTSLASRSSFSMKGDRMLDMGFSSRYPQDSREDARRAPEPTFLGHVPARDPRACRSPPETRRAASRSSPSNPTADGVSQIVHPIDRQKKSKLLSFLIGSNDWSKVLVFARTKRGADRLARHLKGGRDPRRGYPQRQDPRRPNACAGRVQAREDSRARGDGHRRARTRHRRPASRRELRAAPTSAEDYVHRIGRTGRAGPQGWTLSLSSAPMNRKQLQGIERLLGTKIAKTVVEGFCAERASGEAGGQSHANRVRPRGGQKPGWRAREYRGTNGRRRDEGPRGGRSNRRPRFSRAKLELRPDE